MSEITLSRKDLVVGWAESFSIKPDPGLGIPGAKTRTGLSVEIAENLIMMYGGNFSAVAEESFIPRSVLLGAHYFYSTNRDVFESVIAARNACKIT